MKKSILPATLLISISLLSACGFYLRSAGPQFKLIDSIQIATKGRSRGFSEVLAQTFRKASVSNSSTSPYLLSIEREQFHKRVAMVTEQVRASEYEISLVVMYSFAVQNTVSGNNDNKEPSFRTLIHSQPIHLSRSFVYDISRVNAMQKEEQLIKEEMLQEAAYRILHQVQAVSDTLGSDLHRQSESGNGALLSNQ